MYFYIYTFTLFVLNYENQCGMKNKRIIRTYHLTDAELVTKSKEKLRFMRRDAVHFAQYGITESEFEMLEQQIETFSDWETDIEVKAIQTEITLAKKAKADAVIEAIKKVMTIVALKFKKGSAIYKAFGTYKLALQKEADLHLTAKLVVERGLLHMSELSVHGLTLDQLNTITALNNEYFDVLLNQKVAQANRKNCNNDRILLGNEIYTKLKRYTTLGLSIWRTKSEAMYNDYLMYDKTNAKEIS